MRNIETGREVVRLLDDFDADYTFSKSIVRVGLFNTVRSYHLMNQLQDYLS